jgi:Protein of unknown function (DUF2569)
LGNAVKAVEATAEALAIDPSLAREMEGDDDLAELVASNSLRPILRAAARRATLAGIRGWLLLPAIGLVLTVVVGGAGLVAMLRANATLATSRYAGLYTLELFAQIGVLILSVYATIRFFDKKRDAPAAVIRLLVANVAVSALLLAIELSAGVAVLAVENVRALVQGGIAAAIWIPYFRVSERVKATFTTDSTR